MRRVFYILTAFVLSLFIKISANANGVGLADKPYSISKAQDSYPESKSDLEYSEWQETNRFENLYKNGFYVIRTRDKLNNISYDVIKIENLSEEFDVTYIDTGDDGIELGRRTEQKKLGTTVAGSDLGADEAFSKYYEGYTYTSCTSDTVKANEPNQVTRTFNVAKRKVVFHTSDGSILNTETVNYGKGITGNTVPTKASSEAAQGVKSYAFSCWVDKNGDVVDTSRITEDIDLYPVFIETEMLYSHICRFHLNDEADTVIVEIVTPGEPINIPDTFRGNKETEDGTYSYSFTAWVGADGAVITDFVEIKEDIDLYAMYEEHFEPSIILPDEKEVDTEVEATKIEVVKAEKEAVTLTAIDEKDVPHTNALKERIEQNKETITAVAKVGFIAALIAFLFNGVAGISIVQATIFLYAYAWKKRRYVAGAWLLGNEDMRYVDKYGRRVEVVYSDRTKAYTFLRKNKELSGTNVNRVLKDLRANRITYKDMKRLLKESEVYTVFNKDVRFEFGKAKNTSQAIKINLFKSLKDVTADYSIRIHNGSKEFIFDLNNAMSG